MGNVHASTANPGSPPDFAPPPPPLPTEGEKKVSLDPGNHFTSFVSSDYGAKM